MLFADIPEGELPVLLQLSGGSNFVILKEKGKDDECLVQFPDSREAVVDGERLDEVYDGICVFLQPRSSRNNSDLSGLRFPLAGKVFVAGG
jgi:ABC-type bacteriocin/lantibiotic exporter with double-glycine peptidase domain